MFYVPVIVGAVRFGLAGGLATAAGAGLLAGPLVPLGAAEAAANTASVWGARMAFLLLIGAVTAVLVALVREAKTQQAAVAERARTQQLTLIQTLSHEFRTPLTLIRGTAETLQREGLDPSAQDEMTAVLRRSSRKLERLLDAVLAAAGVLDEFASGTPEPVTTIARTAIGDIDRSDAPRRVNLTVGDGHIGGQSAAALQFVIRELVTNALKYSPVSRPVDVEVHCTGTTVGLTVRDRGPGMTPEAVQRALAPFTQEDGSTTREQRGLGLGLFAVRRIVDQCDGRLSLEPHPDGGQVVTVELGTSAHEASADSSG